MHAAVDALVFLSIGALLGAGYFALLFAQVKEFASGSSLRRALPAYFLRLTAVVLALWVIVQYGAPALLASITGFTLVLVMLRSSATS
jgi:N-ATPase, AtpR subunit